MRSRRTVCCTTRSAATSTGREPAQLTEGRGASAARDEARQLARVVPERVAIDEPLDGVVVAREGGLDVGHGAPLRLRVERQLGYKHAKYLMRVTAVDSLARVGKGRGGYWEDVADYEWYAGI